MADDGAASVESEVASTISEPPPDWNSDDEPPEDHIGDEHDCSRDGRVKKVIRRIGRGLDRPGQYDVVRVRWRELVAQGDGEGEAAGEEEVEASMGEDKLPLAVEFAVKTMRIGELAEAKLETAASALDAMAAPTTATEAASREFRARVELLGLQHVHMLTEDRSVTKVLLEPGRGRRMPRVGDILTFSVEREDGEVQEYRVELGTDALPNPSLVHVLVGMKLGERCLATLPIPAAGALPAPEGGEPPRRETWWRFDPPEERKLDLRGEAKLDAERLAAHLLPGDVFEVAEEVTVDGVLFLRLADGRGWAFDGLPGVGALCVRHEAPAPAAADVRERLVVALLGWRRRDLVHVPPPGASGFRPDAEERGRWLALRKVELRSGPERLVHEIEEGTVVLAWLGASRADDADPAAGELLSWAVGEGAVPGSLDAAVASMRLLEAAEFAAPGGAPLAAVGAPPGPPYEGRTPLRRAELPELREVLRALTATPEVDAVGGDDEPPALPPCPLSADWPSRGAPVEWEEVAARLGEAPLRVVLVAAMEAPDVCALEDGEQQRFLDRERAHGNALVKLGRHAEAAAAYTRALDAVRRTSVYKAMFPTEHGRVEGAYSRDAAQEKAPFEHMSPEEVQERRARLVALHLNLGLCATKQGRHAEARRHASAAVGAEPDNAKALFRRGAAASACGDFEDAMADLQRAAELQPNDRAPREELQALQRRMREHRAAERSMYQNVFRLASRAAAPEAAAEAAPP